MSAAVDEPRLAELVGALSLTTDLASGSAYETALRASVVATGLGRALGLDGETLSDVYYATLLRGLGCTAYAHEAAGRRGGTFTWRLLHPHELEAFATVHAQLAQQLAARLGMRDPVRAALGQMHERWDGKGQPHHLRGDALLSPARFAHVAWEAVGQLELGGPDAAVAHVEAERGRAFEPALAEALARHAGEILTPLVATSAWEPFLAAEPEPRRTVAHHAVVEIAHAFACFVDLKSPFTLGHSPGVAHLAEAAARVAGLPADEVARLRLAALLHDLGSVAVPNSVWDKPGPLTPAEWRRVREHATHTERILARSPHLARVAAIAGANHERADGSGYPRGASGGAVEKAARLLAVADAYVAMTEPRAWRPARPAAEAARLCSEEARRGKLAPVAVEAVLAAASHRGGAAGRHYGEGRAGLTVREIEVLTRGGGHLRRPARPRVAAPSASAPSAGHGCPPRDGLSGRSQRDAAAEAARRMAAAARSMSSSLVDQLETEMRMAVRPCQRVPPSQQVPSACTRAMVASVRASPSSLTAAPPTRASTWLSVTSLSTASPPACSRSAIRRASAQQRSTSATTPSRPSARSAAHSANARARRDASGVQAMPLRSSGAPVLRYAACRPIAAACASGCAVATRRWPRSRRARGRAPGRVAAG
jgi:HD-GYP domain-containing protein (c-di-GMP phosphodiesterase class II)